jgi:hypothetical protein
MSTDSDWPCRFISFCVSEKANTSHFHSQVQRFHACRQIEDNVSYYVGPVLVKVRMNQFYSMSDTDKQIQHISMVQTIIKVTIIKVEVIKVSASVHTCVGGLVPIMSVSDCFSSAHT